MMKNKTIKFSSGKKGGDVSGILSIPDDASAFYVFAHGAGAPMDHPFMNKAAQFLTAQGIAVLRYNFPYTEKKSKRIDSAAVLHDTVRHAIEEGLKYSEGLPLFAGGKSMGGRMTSLAISSEPNDNVKGLIFFGFPLHAPGKDSIDRAEHLYNIKNPMLFLQGTRDKLANLQLLNQVLDKIGDKASIKIIEGADHSFHMLKSSGKTDDEVLHEITNEVSLWCTKKY